MKIKIIYAICFALFCLTSTEILAKPFFGVVLGGGGVDDMSLDIKGSNGKVIHVYCHGNCGEWFLADEDEVFRLKKLFKNKKVVVDVISRKNEGEIAGPDDNEKLIFINKIDFLN